jgi:FemAB-related protein (PEP-CTERM system-associated)
LQIRELGNQNRAQWDEFVARSEDSNFFLPTPWKNVLEDVFGSDTHYFMATENGQVVGVLPLVYVKSVLSGHFVSSLPGGMVADNYEAADALLERGKDLVRNSGASYLILRDSRTKWELPGLVTDEEHVSFAIEVDRDLEEVKGSFKKRTRQLVNQSERGELKLLVGLEVLDEFYQVYARAMRSLGTPTPGLEFFKSAGSHLPENMSLLAACYGNRIVGGGFISPFGDVVYCTWSGILREYYGLRPSHFLIWETIKYARENGYRHVDLGRSGKGSGAYAFKKDFGGQVVQLYQQTYLNKPGQAPAVGHSMNEDVKFRAFTAVWRRLPLPVTEFLGPRLRKRIPFG